MKNNQIELLAPAGNLESALTAYKYGADAVYAGLGRFNAREMGKNFSFEDMSKLSAYSKKNQKKFYLTLNTLVKELEVEALFAFLDRVDELEPDALILQDVGLTLLLKEFYPHLELHGSTQMGIHNSAGVQSAKEMGLTRIILERQVSMEELRTITAASPIEVEVFIHGALCCGLSGHCLFSSWIGGWSGNRGRCKQPCRRRYHGTDESGEKKSGFFFSPQDLYALDLLGDLKEAGVKSLKIEGRLKNPDYVRNVVTAYRMVLDAPSGQERQILGQARNILSGSYGRKWSHGFYIEKELPDLIQYDSMGVSGQYLGSVVSVKTMGFKVQVNKRLHQGDRIRIQPKSGDEGPAVTITKMSKGNRQVKVASQGETVFIHCDKEIPSSGYVYKIGISRKEDIPDPSKLPLHNPPRLIDLAVTLNAQGMSARVVGLPDVLDPIELKWNESPEAASKRPLEASALEDLFRASRNDSLKAGDVKIDLDGQWFIPMSVQKARRREFWDLVEEKLPQEEGGEVIPGEAKNTAYELLRSEWQKEYPGKRERHITLALGGTPPQDVKGRNTVAHFFEEWDAGKVRLKGEEEIILPHFCPQDKLKEFTAKLEKLKSLGIKRFRITSLYQLSLFKEHHDCELTAAYPLPIVNIAAIQLMKQLGVTRVQGWLELEEEALSSLHQYSALPLEIYQRGRPFLLATRAPVEIDGNITDSRGKGFVVKHSEDLHYVYPRQYMELPMEGPDSLALHLKDADLYCEGGRDKGTSVFNFDKSLI